MRLFVKVANAYLTLTRQDFRLYLHSPQSIQARVEESGLTPVTQSASGPWEIALFERSAEVNREEQTKEAACQREAARGSDRVVKN